MPLTSPNLDDRQFNQLLQDALSYFRSKHPNAGWDDLSPSDPGMILLELYAYITDIMLYRVNQVPDRVYIALLNLIGVQLRAPTAARVKLLFTQNEGATDKAVIIRSGTRVTMARADGNDTPPVFLLIKDVTIPAGSTQAEGIAYHCVQVNAEKIGVSNGLPGQVFHIANAPIIADTPEGGDLLIGVEVDQNAIPAGATILTDGEKTYRLWNEVGHFALSDTNRFVYRADRLSGTIEFAPMMQSADGTQTDPLAEIPHSGAELRVWYRYGGGESGNVLANTLDTMKDMVAGVTVTNPARAFGGQPAEALENALIRGPHELRSLNRVVTADDYENIALTRNSVARAYAYPQAEVWSFGVPGTVEILVLPDVDDSQRMTITRDELESLQEEIDQQNIRDKIKSAIDERRPLGTKCLVNWVNTKSVRVIADIVARPQEDTAKLQAKITERIQRYINPFPIPAEDRIEEMGWRFGAPLRASSIYNIALKELGVDWVERVKLAVEEVPDTNVTSLIADHYKNEDYQPETFYASSGVRLFRSLNNAKSWELLRRFDEGENILHICAHDYAPGWLAVITWQPEAGGMNIFVSRDSGESWYEDPISYGGRIHDAAWLQQQGHPVLLLCTDKGLVPLIPEAELPLQAPITVERGDPDLGYYAIKVYVDTDGVAYVAVAATNRQGVYLSMREGRNNTFRHLMGQEGIGLRGQDVRALAVQKDGTNLYLWAGTASSGGQDVGAGCFSWRMQTTSAPIDGWQAFDAGWEGGTCRKLLVRGNTIFAVSHRQGLMRLEDPHAGDGAAWKASGYRSQLPIREEGEFEGQFVPLLSGAISRDGSKIMVGNAEGVYSSETGNTFEYAAPDTFIEEVSLPKTWLFISGEHQITVRSNDETR